MTEAHRTHNRGKGPDPVGHQRRRDEAHEEGMVGEAAATKEEFAEQSHFIFNSSKIQQQTTCHEGRSIRKNYERNFGSMRFLVTAALFLMSAAQSITLSNGKW